MSPPIRTCIGCRRRDDAAALVRLSVDQDRLVVRLGVRQVLPPGSPAPQTPQARPGGRGASIHPAEACVRKALKMGAFARAFRRRVEVPEDSLLVQQITTARTQG